MSKILDRPWPAVLAFSLLATPVGLLAKSFGDWSAPFNAETLPGSGADVNTAGGDGCPILDPYTNDLFIAASRGDTRGGLDIYRAAWNGESWDDPVNVGAPINTAADEFCPSPSRGNRLFFVRRPAGSSDGDIFVAKAHPKNGYGSVERLPEPINSAAQEWSPSYYEEANGTPVLYFSSTRSGSQDIWYSRNWGTPQPATTLNTAADDARPNVRHDGLEIVFDTTRDGGAPDIWTARRNSVSAHWNAPVPISQINSATAETRASISWDGRMLVFGSGQSPGEGGADVFVARRE